MPEIESRKDPLGANRGKPFREHAVVLSDKVRKHIHDKYYIPPYRPKNMHWEITFAALGWKRNTIEKFWGVFCHINKSLSGEVSLGEFLDYFGLEWTPWTERCFTYFDTTGGGDIDFLEFMISVWNVCTFKIDTLSNFAFDMYDLDSDGELSIPEIEKMVVEFFGKKKGEKCLKDATKFAEERGGALNLNAFISFTATHQLLLFPMFQIQRSLQKKIFGVQFWETVDRSSKEDFGDDIYRNDFNPRHVQILLRTYQTGGAAAVLSHTGDPNKGLREWYEKKMYKEEGDVVPLNSNDDQAIKMERQSASRKSVLKKRDKSWKKTWQSILDGKTIKRSALDKLREPQTNLGAKENSKATAAVNAFKNSQAKNREESKDKPAEVNKQKDLKIDQDVATPDILGLKQKQKGKQRPQNKIRPWLQNRHGNCEAESNIRQRQAGVLFYTAGDPKGRSPGWLKE